MHNVHSVCTIELFALCACCRFGRTPRLTFSWTLGYEGFARVAINFVGDRHANRTKIIEGLRRDGVNVTQAATIDLAVGHMMHGSRLDLAGGVAGWAIKPFARERFQVRLMCDAGVAAGPSCGKFKILGLRSC